MTTITEPTVKITRKDWDEAAEFNPNCGPTALCAITGIKLVEACKAIPQFKERHYTSPTMMKKALETMGVKWHERCPKETQTHLLTQYGLVRIQFDGPWYGRFAYHHTHWIAAAEFEVAGMKLTWVFDINNTYGWATAQDWEYITMPTLMPKRGNGKWFSTHRWEFDSNKSP